MNKLSLAWRDVFDSLKITPSPYGEIRDIYSMNSFLLSHTDYKYFSWNDRIYFVGDERKFSMKDNYTGINIVNDLFVGDMNETKN